MRLFLLAMGSVLAASPSLAQQDPAQGQVSPNLRIESSALGYGLQYRIYTPGGYDDLERLPALYVVDGQWYLEQGYPAILDSLIASERIRPLVAVFIDSRNPDRPNQNRRNQQFFCNPRYEAFLSEELVPAVDSTYRTDPTRESRAVLGLSFGGLLAACVGIHEHASFMGIAMQSPATHPVPGLHGEYLGQERLPIRVFLSSGDRRDNEESTRRFRDILRHRVVDFEYVEVPFAHNWQNWGPLLDEVAVFLFGL